MTGVGESSDKPRGDDSDDHNDAKAAMASLEEDYESPVFIEKYLESIEQDLSEETPWTRNIVGQLKRVFLRGVIAIVASGLFAALVAIAAFLLQFPLQRALQLSMGAFFPTVVLVYSSMMTDWLPQAES